MRQSSVPGLSAGVEPGADRFLAVGGPVCGIRAGTSRISHLRQYHHASSETEIAKKVFSDFGDDYAKECSMK